MRPPKGGAISSVSDDVAIVGEAAALPPALDATVVLHAGDVPVIREQLADDKKLPERAIEHDDGSIELPLFTPVVLRWKSTDSGDVKEDPPVTSVTFRRLTGKDVTTIMSSGGDKFIGDLTSAAVRAQFPNRMKWANVFDRMDGADAAACIRIANLFLENGPKRPGR